MLAINQLGNHDIYEDTIYIYIYLFIYLYTCMYSVYIYICIYLHICNMYKYIHHKTIFKPQHHQCQAIYGTADRGAADQDDRTYRPVSLG